MISGLEFVIFFMDETKECLGVLISGLVSVVVVVTTNHVTVCYGETGKTLSA